MGRLQVPRIQVLSQETRQKAIKDDAWCGVYLVSPCSRALKHIHRNVYKTHTHTYTLRLIKIADFSFNITQKPLKHSVLRTPCIALT